MNKYEFTAEGRDPEGKGVYTLQELHELTGALLECGVPGETVPKASDYTFGGAMRKLAVKTDAVLRPLPRL